MSRMANKAMGARDFAKALEDAGVISDINSITRVIIDVDPRNGIVQLYTERAAGPRIAEVAGLPGEMMRDGRAAEPDAPRGVRYHVLVNQELLDADTPWHEAGLTLIEQGGLVEPGARWCLFEDAGAPQELHGKKVELTLTRGRVHEGDPDDSTWISGRRVTG